LKTLPVAVIQLKTGECFAAKPYQYTGVS